MTTIPNTSDYFSVINTLYGVNIFVPEDAEFAEEPYPMDVDLYQSQKALDNAKHAVKDGGIIILIGSCREGLGEKTFEEWMTAAPTARSLIERIRREFRLGGHKAAAIAMVLERAEVDLVSELDDDFVRSIFLEPQPSAQTALDRAFAKLGPDARVLSLPYGGSTLPKIVRK